MSTLRILKPDNTIALREIVQAPTTLAGLKIAAKSSVAQRRWEIETGGMPFGGGRLATDDRSKLLLASAADRATDDPTFTAQWKLDDGSWATLNAPSIIAARDALFAWVSACFAREHDLDVLVDAAADQAALSALTPTIQSFWP